MDSDPSLKNFIVDYRTVFLYLIKTPFANPQVAFYENRLSSTIHSESVSTYQLDNDLQNVI